MNHQLPLDKMSLDEKLETMEALWEDITRSAANFDSPQWHQDVLDERNQHVKDNKEGFVGWEQAKKDINNNR